MTYTVEQIEEWKTKAERWDDLADKIDMCYLKENPDYDPKDPNSSEFIENDDPDVDLTTIGEIAASATGWLAY